MQTEYLILGGGPAGTWAVKGIRQEDPDGRIIIVRDEPYRTYSLPLLTKGYIQGRLKEEDLYLVDEDFYEKNRATFIKGKKAVGVSLKERSVVLDNGIEISYKKLLIATGGRPKRLSIPGGDLRGFITLEPFMTRMRLERR
jgi:NAD(P)H-nitrite reductase large subunit